MTPPLAVRSISPEEHLAFLRDQRSASFLQTPAWAEVKAGWRPESVGWHEDGRLVGAGLVLHRALPRLPRHFSYLPEGPVIDWADEDLGRWLEPLRRHLAGSGSFAIRMGPPVVTRRWSADAVKKGVADPDVRTLQQVPPGERSVTGARVVSQLRELGWRPPADAGGFAAGQPRYNFWIPLRHPDGSPRDEDDVLRSMNQLWRRNIRKADKAGVVTARAEGEALEAELAAFHDLYVHTAERDHFTPRPLSYFTTMFAALGAEDPDRISLYTARHEEDLVAATVLVRVGGHAWYSYGASSTHKREVRGSNAVQWRMVRDVLAAGADVYDLRGITDTLDAEDPHVGLIQFKVGTGGEAVEYAGEWDLPVNRILAKAFDLYLARRQG